MTIIKWIKTILILIAATLIAALVWFVVTIINIIIGVCFYIGIAVMLFLGLKIITKEDKDK